MSDLTKFYEAIDANKEKYIQRLADYCAIPSVSGQVEHKEDTVNMVKTCAEDLQNLLGVTDYEVHDNPAGPDYPPILLAKLGSDPKKATLLVYGHLDVQPADSEGWTHQDDPFKLTKKVMADGTVNYYGRGSTDDKGPILGWINAIEAYQSLGMEIPVNIKFCLEAMEESGGAGLDQLIEEQASFFHGVDYVCISDNYWLGKTKPCVTYGLRGIAYYNVTIKCAESDLHSGVYGGTVREAMIDLINIFSKLTDGKGCITIPKVNETVDPMTDEELATYADIDFDPEEYRTQIGTNELLYPDKVGTLTHRWRYPSLSIHGFVGASDVDADQTIIPKEVKGKFSIRLVPSQDPAIVMDTSKLTLRSYTGSVEAKTTFFSIQLQQHQPGLAIIQVIIILLDEMLKKEFGESSRT